jgi:hypothetical protein
MGFEPMTEFYPGNRLAGGPNRPLWHLPKMGEAVIILNCQRQAEGEGFEPPVNLRPLRFSRPLQSTALPSLRENLRGNRCEVYHGRGVMSKARCSGQPVKTTLSEGKIEFCH